MRQRRPPSWPAVVLMLGCHAFLYWFCISETWSEARDFVWTYGFWGLRWLFAITVIGYPVWMLVDVICFEQKPDENGEVACLSGAYQSLTLQKTSNEFGSSHFFLFLLPLLGYVAIPEGVPSLPQEGNRVVVQHDIVCRSEKLLRQLTEEIELVQKPQRQEHERVLAAQQIELVELLRMRDGSVAVSLEEIAREENPQDELAVLLQHTIAHKAELVGRQRRLQRTQDSKRALQSALQEVEEASSLQKLAALKRVYQEARAVLQDSKRPLPVSASERLATQTELLGEILLAQTTIMRKDVVPRADKKLAHR